MTLQSHLEINRYYNDKLEAKDAEIAAWKQLSAQHEIEIARLRKRVQELEASFELACVGIKEMERRHEYCDCSDDPRDDICIGCNLRKILVDMET